MQQRIIGTSQGSHPETNLARFLPLAAFGMGR